LPAALITSSNNIGVTILPTAATAELTAARVHRNDAGMNDIIFPRSPRETMDGWAHLPRYVDKIRLHLAGQLHADYQPNFGTRGFDKSWLDAAGVTHEQMVAVVQRSVTDGEVCDWVKHNVKKSATEKAALLASMLKYPAADDAEGMARLKMRKEQAGLADRADIQNFVDFIDADEKRS
jgi:hypothetical protein